MLKSALRSQVSSGSALACLVGEARVRFHAAAFGAPTGGCGRVTGNSASVVLGTYMARLSSTPSTRGTSRLLAFKLGGTAILPAAKPIVVNMPPRPKQPAELAKKGAILFEQNFCVDCHGYGAESANGSIPDLRNSSAETHDAFEAIVIGGLRKDEGMPRFEIPLADVQAIHAYLINQAWSNYEAQKARTAVH